MGSCVKQIPNDEAFWIGLVETNLRLGWEKCLVPLENLEPEAAQNLADRLEVRLEVTSDGYTFTKADTWIQPKREVNPYQPAGSA
jgi:hypothetical protein